MNYQAIYDSLVDRYRDETKESLNCYSETHHIIPKCMGGSNDPKNLVVIPARVHFVLHKLLVKIHTNSRRLWWSLHNMSAGKLQKGTSRDYRITSHTYANLRANLARLGRSDETKQKISKALTGRKIGPFTEEHRNKIGDANRGKKKPPRSQEHIDKIASSNRGKKRTTETRELMSTSMKATLAEVPEEIRKERAQRVADKRRKNGAYVCSEETKRKMRESHLKRYQKKRETGKKIDNGLTGSKKSEETKQKMSEAKKGRKFTKEQRENMKAAQRARRARERGLSEAA